MEELVPGAEDGWNMQLACVQPWDRCRENHGRRGGATFKKRSRIRNDMRCFHLFSGKLGMPALMYTA